MFSRQQPPMHLLRSAWRVTLLWLTALPLLSGGVLAQRSVDLSALDAWFSVFSRTPTWWPT